MSATFGKAFLFFSIPALITFISFTSSTSPLGQELFTMTRSQPLEIGTLLHSRPAPSSNATSIKLRWHVTGHQLQMVSLEVVVVYVSPSITSKPRNWLLPPFSHQSSETMAAPIAPASPEYGCTTTSASGTFERMKSTCVLTTARFLCVPPCRMNFLPTAPRLFMPPA